MFSRAQAVLLTSLFAAAAFSGCVIISEGEPSIKPDRIIKKATLSLDETTEDAETLDDILDVRFEYRHEGDPVDPADVMVEYLGTDGEAHEEPLSEFTNQGTVEHGDIITISPVNLTSGLSIEQGGQTLASRGSVSEDWLWATGYPLPVASDETGVASYALKGDSEFRLSASDFSFDDESGEGGRYESVDASWEAHGDGSLVAKTTSRSTGPRIDVEADLEGDSDFEFDTVMVADGEEQNAGARGNFESRLTGLVRFQFGSDRELETVGSSSDIWADGDVVAWDPDHPKRENWHPEDIEHPMIDEEMEYEEDTVEWDPEDVDEIGVEFLARLWSMDVGVGDEYRFHAGYGDEEAGDFSMDVVVQIIKRERRSVGAGSFDTYRVSQSVSVLTDSPAFGSSDFDVADFTIWVDSATHLPVYEQGSYARSFDQEDIERIFESMGEFAPVTAPKDASLVLSGEWSIELEDYSGDFAISPIAGVTGVGGGGQFLAAAASGFMLLSDIGSDDYEAAPSFSVTTDEELDAVEVVSASTDADWNRLQMKPSIDVQWIVFRDDGSGDFPGLEPGTASADEWTSLYSYFAGMQAGDILAVCADVLGASETEENVTIQLKDFAADALMVDAFFFDVNAC